MLLAYTHSPITCHQTHYYLNTVDNYLLHNIIINKTAVLRVRMYIHRPRRWIFQCWPKNALAGRPHLSVRLLLPCIQRSRINITHTTTHDSNAISIHVCIQSRHIKRTTSSTVDNYLLHNIINSKPQCCGFRCIYTGPASPSAPTRSTVPERRPICRAPPSPPLHPALLHVSGLCDTAVYRDHLRIVNKQVYVLVFILIKYSADVHENMCWRWSY
jgi:hypothetical protein